MRLLDNAKEGAKGFADKAQHFAVDHADQVKAGIGKAGDLANRATRGRFSGTIDSLGKKAEQLVPSKGPRGGG